MTHPASLRTVKLMNLQEEKVAIKEEGAEEDMVVEFYPSDCTLPDWSHACRTLPIYRILQDSLEGTTRELMVACLNLQEHEEYVHIVSLAAISRYQWPRHT
ncbi:PREDICTED: uncharacterized protein LOC109340834 isoform X2 [Lupinus angustifolius]|uniref:uncharacterized protein LOC109340834 isoform X2 n=1 Tax=Lupinus angustifolius TaxID=3871 RepID=UPI00092E5A81|nr:PREDICTED: uncharacterized protein LOC109340834 isoform X2 [Lupinus angustifolius]